MDSKTETLKILERLRNAFYPPPDIADDTWKIYSETLCDFSPGVLSAAAVYLAKTSRFWPSIAEIRRACFEASGDRAKLPAVGEAYAEARRAASSTNAYAKPTAEDFSHAIVHRAAIQAAGSWRRWCLTDLEFGEAALRAKFFDVYRELRERELSRLALPKAARQLTAEESRQILEDISARAEREPKQLAAGANPEALKSIHELFRSNPPFAAASKQKAVGAEISQTEWEARKAAIVGTSPRTRGTNPTLKAKTQGEIPS